MAYLEKIVMKFPFEGKVMELTTYAIIVLPEDKTISINLPRWSLREVDQRLFSTYVNMKDKNVIATRF